MSHKTGKVEVVGKVNEKVVFRYHRSPDPLKCGRLMFFDSDPAAGWLDDYMKTEPIVNVSATWEAQPIPG